MIVTFFLAYHSIPWNLLQSRLATTSFSSFNIVQALSSSLSATLPRSVPPLPIARRAIPTSTTLWLTLAQAASRASIANGFALVLRSVGIRLAVLFALIFSRFLETRHPGAHLPPSFESATRRRCCRFYHRRPRHRPVVHDNPPPDIVHHRIRLARTLPQSRRRLHILPTPISQDFCLCGTFKGTQPQ